MQWHYKPRWLATIMRKVIEFSPVSVLTGARQTGKTTLLYNEAPFKSWTYLNLDDLETLELAQRRPETLLSISQNLILDEVQRVPEFLLAVKKVVDRERQRRIVLSGSSHLLLMKNISETLAGRSIYLELLPFSLSEYLQRPAITWLLDLTQGKAPIIHPEKPDEELDFLLFRGFMPPVSFLRSEEQIYLWWQGYIKTYLEKDLRDLANISYLPDFRRMMQLLALRCGQILKQSEIARDAGLSQATAARYINLLEIGGLLIKLRPYTKSISKRIIKSPKVYFIDPGLACALCGFKSKREVPAAFWGALFEGFVLSNLSAMASLYGGELYYLRTQGGKEREVDFILKINQKLIVIEVKHRVRIDFKDAEHIYFFKELLPEMRGGVVIYTGDEVIALGENIYGVPWQAL